jgi:transposase
VLAELCWRDLVPEIWLPDPAVRGERERARFRLHLVRHRTSLKNRVHATLIAHGIACPVSDLFGLRGRQLLERLALPQPWQQTLERSLELIDDLDSEIDRLELELAELGASHRYIPLL